MTGRGQKGDDERALFERAMNEVKPLGEPGPEWTDEELAQRPGSRKAPRTRASADSPRRTATSGLRTEVDGEQMTGLASGIDRRQLRRLRRGQLPVELEIDLHGFTASEARSEVGQALARATRSGWRCVRIIHGRGRGSRSGPVLKQALPRWLAEAPPPVRVLAFTTAGPQRGGPGATLVLLHVSASPLP